jgi:hypothetical protein
MSFHKIVVIIAILTLIGALTFIGYAMYNKQHTAQFPPVITQCPDYWESKGKLCYNTKPLGTCALSGDQTVNFNTDYFNGPDEHCKKVGWANGCGVSWQGITNNADMCH